MSLCKGARDSWDCVAFFGNGCNNYAYVPTGLYVSFGSRAVYKYVLANFIQGGVKILLVTSCCRNRDKLVLEGTLGLKSAIFLYNGHADNDFLR